MSVRAALIVPMLAVVALGGVATPGSTAYDVAAPSRAATAPDPADFTQGRVTNPWFPLKPGTRTVFHGTKDGSRSRDVVVVLHQTRTIQGVVCRAVWDRLFIDGALEERTVDWYAQHRNGDVWYFGERTAELDQQGSVLSREGSWLAGRDGARAGIFMTAHPQVGQTQQQEFYPGHAEDHFTILDLSAQVTVPLLWSSNALLTKEWTPLEPDVLDHKFYVRDLGLVLETSVRGPREVNRLVSVGHGHP
jgi:hypothetical protein